MLMGCASGAVPISVTVPVTDPAVAGSTGFVTGAGAAEEAGCDPPPPQAAPMARDEATRQARAAKDAVMSGYSDPRLSHAACRRDLAQHAVLHPLLAPPVDRRHLLTADQHREVEVVAAGEPRHPAAADLLAFLHLVAHLDADRREVGVERLHTETVVEHHTVAVDPEVGGVHHRAPLGGHHGDVGGDREVEAEVDLLVDLLPLIKIRARVGELRLHLRVPEL